jgi:hypothetical protein
MSDEAIGSMQKVVEHGTARTIISTHPDRRYAIIFEDDTETGYVYALDQHRDGDPICDAALIYQGLPDGEFALEIFWHPDRATAAISADNTPQCVIDFETQRIWCRSGFPPADPAWTSNDKAWTDDCLELFRLEEE